MTPAAARTYALPVVSRDAAEAGLLAAALSASPFWSALVFGADAEGFVTARLPNGAEIPEATRQELEWFARGVWTGVRAALAAGTDDCPRCAEYRARDERDEIAAERFNEWEG